MERMKISYRFSLVLISFLLPSGIYALVLPALAIFFIGWIYEKDYRNLREAIRTLEVLLPVALYTYILLGFFFATNKHDALSSLSTRLPYLLFPLVVGSSSIIDGRLVKRAGKAFVLSTCIAILIAIAYGVFDLYRTGEAHVLLNEAIYHKLHSFGLTRVFDNWHPTYVAMFANFSIAIILHYNMQRTVHRQNGIVILQVLGFCILTTGIILLGSIINILAFLLIIVYYILRLAHKFKVNMIAAFAVLGILAMSGLAFFYFNPLQIEKLDSLKTKEFKVTDKQQERNFLTMRMAKWETHLSIIRSHFVWGTSSGDISEARRSVYMKKGYEDLAKYDYNAHNEFLEIFATYGLIGFAIFMAMLIVPLFHFPLYWLYVPFLAAVSITSLTESILNRQQGLLFFAFMYALYTHRNLRKTSLN